MVNYNNVKEYKDLPFEQYIKLKGLSHSYLKGEQNGVPKFFEVNEKMRLGSMVDAFLTQPDEIDFSSPLFNIGREIAISIKKEFGSIISHLEPQISYTGELEFQGFKIQSQGRLDWLLRGHAVVDLKVTEATDLKPLIKFMGYDNQMWHYGGFAKVNKSFILAYSTKLKKCLPLIEITRTERNEFWEGKILKFGTV